ncbi:MAG: ankyrin repeat domain-containing protein, partial [Clostridia bacterium]|nr:ankyrin repeat domain-containing protein [Clostridia bacterium]
ENGADSGLCNIFSRAPLHFAAESGNKEIIALIVDAGADVNCTDKNGVTPLMLMAKNGKTDAALAYIKNPNVDISLKDNDNHAAIDYATASGLRELVKALSSDSEQAHTDAHGNTPLHQACWNGQVEVVRVLLEKSPDLEKLNDDGESPLILAVERCNLVIVELLLEKGAKADGARLDGVAPLHLAAQSGEQFIGKALIKAGANKNAKTADGKTPLILAAQGGRNDFTAMLIEAGADLNAVDNSRHSAMHYASEAGYTEIVEQLLMAGAEN